MGDPLFVPPANFDFHLSSKSQCIDKGFNTGIPSDFELTPRPQRQAFDKGAYEYPSISGLNKALRNNEGFHLFPNPAKDIINIWISSVSNSKITIFNIQGLSFSNFKFNSNKVKIPIQDLASGIYIIVIETDDQPYKQLLIKI